MNCLDLYTYKDKPGISTETVKIYPLNENGLTTYLLKKDSHVANYLDKFKRNYHLLKEMSLIYNGNKKETSSQPKESNSPKEKKPSRIETTSSMPLFDEKNLMLKKLNFHKKRNLKVENNTKPQSKKLSKSMDTTSKNKEDYYYNLLYKKRPDISESTNVYFQKIQNKIRTQRNKERNVLSLGKINQQQTYVAPKEFKLNKYFKSFRKKMEFEDVYGYPKPLNMKTRGNVYNNEISFLKENMKSSITKVLNSKSNSRNKYLFRNESDGKLKHSNSFIIFTKGLHKSMNINSNDLSDCLDLKTKKILQNKNKEMVNKLTEQINPKFLKKHKLPDIRALAECSDVIRKVKDSLCREFGPKYDPYAYVISKPQIKRRNYVGGLFQH